MMARRNITDRAQRYRANRNAPAGARKCLFCGSTSHVGVDHIDGHEEHGEIDNLIYLCKSCNTAKGFAMRNARVGRLTRQYNPTRSGGAATVGEWMRAVGSITPHKGAKYSGENYGLVAAMPVGEAVAMIRATPADRRREFASRLRRHNPMKKTGKFERCVKEVSKKGGAYDPKAVCGAKHRKQAKNPSAAAIGAYKDFHGHAPDQDSIIKEKQHRHRHLSGAGELKFLVIDAIDQRHRVKLTKFKGALLAFNETKNQLFIKGGDQAVRLEDFGIQSKAAHEIETLGHAIKIGYHTNKSHLGNEGGEARYDHVFRTTNENGKHVTVKIARYPDVIYYVLDEQLVFSGGSYKILAEGIDQ